MQTRFDVWMVLYRQGHRLALGVALIVVAGLGLPSLTDAGLAENQARIEAATEVIRQRQRAGAPTPPPPPPALATLTASWEPVETAFGEPGWVMHRKPAVHITEPERARPVIVLPPRALRAAVSLGSLDLMWQPPAASHEGKARARLLGYRLSRWPDGRPEEPRVVHLGPGETRYADRRFAARTTYHYRLEAVYEHARTGKNVAPVIGGTPTTLTAGPRAGQRVRRSDPVSCQVTSRALVELTYRSHANGNGGFDVRWYDLDRQRWHTRRVTVEPGQLVPRSRLLFLGSVTRIIAGRRTRVALVEEVLMDGTQFGGLPWTGPIQELPMQR